MYNLGSSPESGHTPEEAKMRYDVIIIGGGSAGATLAGRFSQDSQRSVLLLEAGPDYPDLEHLPDEIRDGNNTLAAAKGPYMWDFVAKVNEHQPQPLEMPQAKVIGGGSSINGTVFVRGLSEDFDAWADWGNDEWSYTKVLPYFRKLETDLDYGGDFHGRDGPIPVRRFKQEAWQPTQKAFYQACRNAGFPDNPDMNLPDNTGVGPRPLNNVNGLRISTAIAYLNPNRHRLNLTIKGKALVQHILFNGSRAVGVEVESGGETFRLEGGEIILSAGAIGSPTLLLRSGVGPADHLRSLGIPVVHDLPGVGENLRNHPPVYLQFRLEKGVREEQVPNHVGLRYTATGSASRNDMFISPSQVDVPLDSVPHIQFCVVLESARAAGRLTIASSNPEVQPALDYRYLTDPWDLARMREGVRLALRLAQDPAFRDIVEERVAPKKEDLASDEALDRWLLTNVTTAVHLAGTCKMGPSTDPLAVVNQYGRVHGLEGLRVVDASIMPDVARANTNATVIMIAERVVDWIKEGTTG